MWRVWSGALAGGHAEAIAEPGRPRIAGPANRLLESLNLREFGLRGLCHFSIPSLAAASASKIKKGWELPHTKPATYSDVALVIKLPFTPENVTFRSLHKGHTNARRISDSLLRRYFGLCT